MSTNIDLNPEQIAADLSGSSLASAAGLPDPADLARYANQFFQELNGTDISGALDSAASQAVPGTGISPSLTGAPGLSPISEADLQHLASSAANPQGVDPFAPLQASGSSFIPGGISATDFSGIQSFGFLADLRGLSSQSTAHAERGYSEAARLADETRVGQVPSSVPGHLPAIPETSAVPPVGVPNIAGAPIPREPEGFTYPFIESARSLSVIDPVLQPADDLLKVPSAGAISPFDVNAIRRDFPILQEKVNGKPLIWLDNAATTQKPSAVIDRLKYFYEHENSNVHRAAHELAARSTDAYDAAREKVRRFLNASTVKEIVFVRGATEAINLIAQSWGRQNIGKGDEIVVSHLEHHANIVPWQMLCSEKGARLRVIPVDDSGQILLDEYQKLLGPQTKLVAFAQVSNALGTVTPVQEMVEMAHRAGAKVLVDGAQAVSHLRVDVQAYDCDFYVFSGHKVFAPTGIGVVYGKEEILQATQPWQGGGNMIVDVTFERTVYHPAPFRFEAGTGSIGDAVGLGAAIDYLDRVGMENVSRYEHDLLVYATDGLKRIPGLRLIGTANNKASVLSFVLDGFTNDEVGQALNREGIAVRTGHHCAQPILRRFGVESTVRPSLAFYNTCEEIDTLIAAIWNLKNGRGAGI